MGLADAPVGAVRHRRTNEKSGPRGMWLSPSGRAEVWAKHIAIGEMSELMSRQFYFATYPV